MALAGCAPLTLPELPSLPQPDPADATTPPNPEPPQLFAPTPLQVATGTCRITGAAIALQQVIHHVASCYPQLDIVIAAAIPQPIAIDAAFADSREAMDTIARLAAPAGITVARSGLRYEIAPAGGGTPPAAILVHRPRLPADIRSDLALRHGATCTAIPPRELCYGTAANLATYRDTSARIGATLTPGIHATPVALPPEVLDAVIAASAAEDRISTVALSDSRTLLLTPDRLLLRDILRASEATRSGCTPRTLRLATEQAREAQLNALTNAPPETWCSPPVILAHTALVSIADAGDRRILQAIEDLSAPATGYLRIVILEGTANSAVSIRSLLSPSSLGAAAGLSARDMWHAYQGGPLTIDHTVTTDIAGDTVIVEGLARETRKQLTTGLTIQLNGEVRDSAWTGSVSISDSTARDQGAATIACEARVHVTASWAVVCLRSTLQLAADIEIGLDTGLTAGAEIYLVALSYLPAISADTFPP